MEKKEGGALQTAVVAAAACRGGGVGGQNGGWHIQWEARTVGGTYSGRAARIGQVAGG